MSTDREQTAECFVCRKHRGEINIPGGVIYEDKLVYASHLYDEQGIAQEKAYLGWIMLEIKRHAAGLADQTDEEAQAMGLHVARLSRALKACEGAEHVYAFVLGHHVPHLHIHIAARYPGTPREFWGLRVDEWPDAPRGGQAEIAALSQRVRTYLHNEGK